MTVVSDFARKQHNAIFAAGPELPKLKMPEEKCNPVERILNIDEETFRKLFDMTKLTKADLPITEDQEIDRMD